MQALYSSAGRTHTPQLTTDAALLAAVYRIMDGDIEGESEMWMDVHGWSRMHAYMERSLDECIVWVNELLVN